MMVCMYDLDVNEVMDNEAVVDTMAISEVVDDMAFDEGDDDGGVDDAMGVDGVVDDGEVVDDMAFDEGDDDGGVDDAMGVDGVVDDGEVVDEAGDDAMEVDEVVDYAKVVDDAMGVDGVVDDGELVDEAVDDAVVVYDVVDDVMVAYDEEVVDEKLQLDVDTVVELHFHVLLLGIQSTENKRKCQKNITGHCKFPHGTNKPISNLIVLRDNHHFSIQVYTAKYLPKNISKGNGMAAWPRSRRVRLAIQRSWVLFSLLGLVEFVLSHPKFKSTATGCLLPVGVFHPVMLYLNYLFLLSI